MPMIRASLKPMAFSFKPCSDTSGDPALLLSPALSTSTPFPKSFDLPNTPLHYFFPVSSPTTAGDGDLPIQFLQRLRENGRVLVHLRLRGRRRHQGHVVERRYEYPAVERVQVQQRLELVVVRGCRLATVPGRRGREAVLDPAA